MKKVFLTGINGSGKTTILQYLSDQHNSIRTIRGSHSYMSYLGIANNDYDALRKVTEETHNKEFPKFIALTLNGSANKHLIIDGHIVVFDQHDSPVIKVSDWIQYFDHIVLLEAEPRCILDRVLKDHVSNKRSRSFEFHSSLENIEKDIGKRMIHMRNVAKRASEWFEVPLTIISNIDTTNTVDKIQTIILGGDHEQTT